jgi:hypothetical protein
VIRYYSSLSPNGTPEPAALAAAETAPHEWVEDGGIMVLRVLGLGTDDVVFCRVNGSLYIHQHQKIVKVPDFFKDDECVFCLEVWEKQDEKTASVLVRLPRQNKMMWMRRNGEGVDLLRLDQEVFKKTGVNSCGMPMFSVGGVGQVNIILPYKFIDFLKKEVGEIQWKIEEVGENLFKLSAIGSMIGFSSIMRDFDLKERLERGERIVVMDRQTRIML